jgi:hypothetical protein
MSTTCVQRVGPFGFEDRGRSPLEAQEPRSSRGNGGYRLV